MELNAASGIWVSNDKILDLTQTNVIICSKNTNIGTNIANAQSV